MKNESKQVFRGNLVRWYRRERRNLPWRGEDVSPYEVAVAELMCQQTQIGTVLPYYERWMRRWPDWESLARAKEEEVLKMWEGLGYYRRARMLWALAKEVLKRAERELPSDVIELRKMPGVGPYIAGAIASIAFGKRAALVDGNVERVLCRVFGIKKIVSRRELENLAEKLLPEKGCGDFNQALMECGSQICTPRKPRCPVCPLKRVCRVKKEEKNPELLPMKRRNASVAEKETLAWIQRNGKVWLELPKNPRRWKSFYRLPHFDEKTMKRGKVLAVHSYTITKYRVRTTVLDAKFEKKTSTGGRWFSESELKEIFLPAPHRKMVEEIF